MSLSNQDGSAIAINRHQADSSPSQSRPQVPRVRRTIPTIHDIGVSVVWEPDQSIDVVADVIFVHGLGGHPQRAWQYGKPPRKPKPAEPSNERSSKKLIRKFFSRKQAAEPISERVAIEARASAFPEDLGNELPENYCYWPFHLVPDVFDRVRVLAYGHDTSPTHYYRGRTNQMTISQHSRQLLQLVSDVRLKCRGRTIIFVAHSLGGILVKDAIVQSAKHEHQPALQDLSSSTSAIFFFGTPHQGANAAAYGEIIAKIVGTLPFAPSIYKEVLHGLKLDGEKLANVTADFNDILNKDLRPGEKIQIYNFIEGNPKVSLNTIDGKIVPDYSASFNRRDIEQTSFVMANHSNMCKFRSSLDPGFVAFRSALSGYLRRITDLQSEPKVETTQELPYDLKDLTRTLEFGGRIERQQQLASLQTDEVSFEWIWTSDFAEWLKGQDRMFWISGAPGSGKSTLVEYFMKSDKTIELLGELSSQEWTTVYHFFDFRAGEGLANNYEGFLRSLLIQLLQKFPEAQKSFQGLKDSLSTHHTANESTKPTLGISHIRDALKGILQTAPGRVLIALDGLDEYSGNKSELVSFMKRMASEKVKICLASRLESPFTDAFADLPAFRMHDLNRPGIRAYALSALKDSFPADSSYIEDKLTFVAEQVASESNGVFLWARFATLETISGLSSGEATIDNVVEEVLLLMPTELDGIYARILEKRNERQKAIARVALMYTGSAMRQMSLPCFTVCWDYDPSMFSPTTGVSEI